MHVLAFGTGNNEKFAIGRDACREAAIELQQVSLDVEEIQGEDMSAIAIDKARRAYAVYGRPLIISDDSWAIPGLGGFPGAYMKSINHWFSTQDLINLTSRLADRRIILKQTIVYIEADTVQLFSSDNNGILVTTPRGEYGKASHKLVVLDGDNGLTMAEVLDISTNHATRSTAKVWHEFAVWYKDSNVRRSSE